MIKSTTLKTAVLGLLLSLTPGWAKTINLGEHAATAEGDSGVSKIWGPTGDAWYFQEGKQSHVPIRGVTFGKEYTFETWLKFDPKGTEGVSTLLSSDRNRRYRLSIIDGSCLVLEYSNTERSRSVFECAYDFEPGRWYHVALSMGPEAGVAIYVNGRLLTMQPPPVPAMASFPVAALGAFQVAAGLHDHFFHGALSGAKLHSSVISADEVLAAYKAGSRVPEIIPLPRQVRYDEGKPGFALTGVLDVGLDPKLMGYNDPALKELIAQWRELTKEAARVVDIRSDRSRPRLMIRQGDPGIGQEGDIAQEAYRLTISGDGIEITALSKRGAAYALYALMDMAKNGVTELPAMEIRDWPEFPFRGFLYLSHHEPPALTKDRFQRDMRQLIPTLARHRVNQLMVRTADWILLDDPKVEEMARKLVAYAAEHHLELVPLSRSYGHAKQFLWRDLRTGHTDMIQDEQVTLAGDQAVALKTPNVIVTKHTPILVKGRSGKTYVENVDYKVIDGELTTKWGHPPGTASAWSRPFLPPENKPWQIQRLRGGSIADGESVSVTYDVARVMQGRGHGGYNPFSEFTRDIQKDSITRMAKLTRQGSLKTKYVNFGLDEIWVMRTQGRSSTHNDWSEEKTLVYEANLLNAEIRAANPSARMMMWSDMIDPRQTPGWRGTLDYRSIMSSDLDRNIIMMPWFYNRTSNQIVKILGSLRYLIGEGFEVAGTSGHDPLNNLIWGDALFHAKHTLGGGVQGLLYTTWAGGKGDVMGGLPAFAQSAWSPDQVRTHAAVNLVERLRQAGVTVTPERDADPAQLANDAIAKWPDKGVMPLRLKAELARVEEDMANMGETRIAVLQKLGFDLPFYLKLGSTLLEQAEKR